MSLQALREKRANFIAKMRGVLDAAASDSRDLNEAEAKSYDEMKASADGLKSQIDRLEGLEKIEAELEQPVAAVASRNIPRARGPEAKREFESLGEFLAAARFNPNDQRLSWQDGSNIRGEQRMDDGASGGFAVPVQFRSELLKVDPMAAAMRPRATVIPAGTPPDGEISMPALDQSNARNIYGGVTVSWIGEGGTKPETTTYIQEVKLKPNEVAAQITVTDKLLRNWQAASPLISNQLRMAIAAAEDVAFLTGDGVAKPLGVLKSTAATVIARANANLIDYTDVLKMEEVLFGNEADVFWVCTKKARTQLRQLKNVAGYYIWQEDARSGVPPTLLGHPVVVSDRVPSLGSKGDLMLIDPSKYLIKDGSGPFVAASEHVLFTQNKTVIKAFWNVDGQSWLKSPIKTENGELQSPFVILQ